MNTNTIDKSIQELKLGMSPINNDELVLQSEESTSSASQINRENRLCQQLDELCQFFDKKQTDKTKQKELQSSNKQGEYHDNLINKIVKNLEYENFNSKFFVPGQDQAEIISNTNCKRMNKLQGKFMCDLPLSEELAMKYHSKVKNIIRVFKLQMKDYGIKDKVRSIQDQLQRIKICHANRRRQREHREQNKAYREEYYQKIKTADNTPSSEGLANQACEPVPTPQQSVDIADPVIVPEQSKSTISADQSFLQMLTTNQETIQMEHLKILNTNMMLEICSNELQIAIKEQKIDMQQIQEKISNAIQQINKQKLLLFNNFQNITKCFNQQRETFEQSSKAESKDAACKTSSQNLLTKRRLVDTKLDENNARYRIIQRGAQHDLQIDQNINANDQQKNMQSNFNCLQQLQSSSAIMKDMKQQMTMIPQEDLQDSRSEQFFKLEPSMQFNQHVKLNIDQNYELQSAQENLMKSTSLTALSGQYHANMQVMEDATGKQKAFNEQMMTEAQLQIAGQNTNVQKKSIWMNQSEYQEMKKISGFAVLRTPGSKRQKSSSNETSANPLFN